MRGCTILCSIQHFFFFCQLPIFSLSSLLLLFSLLVLSSLFLSLTFSLFGVCECVVRRVCVCSRSHERIPHMCGMMMMLVPPLRFPLFPNEITRWRKERKTVEDLSLSLFLFFLFGSLLLCCGFQCLSCLKLI